MHYNLLFNGCSFTDGGELQGKDDDWEHRRTHRFSHIVSQKTGLTYDCISRSGASNGKILRSTVRWFEEGNTCDHAIIQWTNRNRVEYFSEEILVQCPKTPDYYSIYPNSNIKSTNIGRSIQNSFITIQNNSNDQHNEDFCMYWMEKLLKDKCSLDYLKIEKESEVVSDYYKLSPYYKHRTKFPITHINGDILPLNKIIYYCKNIPGYPKLNGGHPNEAGHRKIASYIINNFDYFQ